MENTSIALDVFLSRVMAAVLPHGSSPPRLPKAGSFWPQDGCPHHWRWLWLWLDLAMLKWSQPGKGVKCERRRGEHKLLALILLILLVLLKAPKMEYNPAFSNASPALGMLCPPHASLWIMSKSNARFHLWRTGDLHKFCSVTVGKWFCFYCMFYFSHGICALNLPKGVSSASSRVALVPTLTHLISVRRMASSVTSVDGWQIPPPASLCCAETALQPGYSLKS